MPLGPGSDTMPSVHLAILIVALVVVVVAGGVLARRLGVPAPLLLTVVGAVASPFVHVELGPEVVLIGILPPLLYAAALQTSLLDFRSNARPIGLLSVGLVIFTTLGVGLVVCWLIPDLPLAAGFAIGAVVAPPDAVAATAIGKRVGLPRRLTTILEGESLVNDATSLVLLRTAVIALGAAVTIGEVALGFLVSAGGGIIVGLVVAVIAKRVRRRVTRPVTDVTISLALPYVAFICAEELRVGEFHASGVLAVVVTGLIMGHVAPVVQTAQSRVFERTIWVTVQAVLEDMVFLLIGLQLWRILTDVRNSTLPPGQIALYCVVVLVAVILLRPIWVFPATFLSRLVPRVAKQDPAPQWQASTVLSWAGMRGVVTLAAAFTLPAETPHREVLVLFALVVTAGTLLIQGSTLPWLARTLDQTGANPAEDVLAEAALLQRALRAGMAELEECAEVTEEADVVDALRQRSLNRANQAWELLGQRQQVTPSERFGELLLRQLGAERAEVMRARDSGDVPHEVVQSVLRQLDVEESVVTASLDRRLKASAGALDADTSGECEHLRTAHHSPAPATNGCRGCLELGQEWVHLRLCMQCGEVGCCDSSPGAHASAHFHETGHPVMRSFEIGEGWRWCFVDDQLG